MLSTLFVTSAAILAGSPFVSAGPADVHSYAECYRGETGARLCYTAPNNTPQDVSVDDIKFAAAYLRSYGRQYKAGRLLTMNVADTPACGEWGLYTHNTVQIIAKHIDTTHNSSVLYKDIANTLDGGVDATADQAAAALFGCGTDGGSLGVIVNATHPAYNSTAYAKLDAVASGIIVKVVSSGN